MWENLKKRSTDGAEKGEENGQREKKLKMKAGVRNEDQRKESVKGRVCPEVKD